ncbi:MAG: hypothetical protein HRT72_11495 [Flavobacteriales bacterium]|nr:hypothetical protein [Flavobacteriales bacterium]
MINNLNSDRKSNRSNLFLEKGRSKEVSLIVIIVASLYLLDVYLPQSISNEVLVNTEIDGGFVRLETEDKSFLIKDPITKGAFRTVTELELLVSPILGYVAFVKFEYENTTRRLEVFSPKNLLFFPIALLLINLVLLAFTLNVNVKMPLFLLNIFLVFLFFLMASTSFL